MNPFEIWLFHIVVGVSRATRDNYHGVMVNIYRYISILGVEGRAYMVHLTFFVYYSKKRKKQ